MPRILIFGAGSIGCVYGYILHQAGVEITAICRSNFDAVNTNGITLKSTSWGNVHYRPFVVRTVPEAHAVGPFDYIFVCIKAFPGGAKLLKEVVSAQSAIVIAQNGIALEDEYEQLYPDNAIISGVVWQPATQVKPGIVEIGGLERLEIGTFRINAPEEHKSRVVELSKLWQAGGGQASVFNDISPKRWSKLAVNCAFNPMAALTHCNSTNLILSSDLSVDIILKVSAEVRMIASAEGVQLANDDEIKDLISWQLQRPKGKDPSMLLDVKAGKAMEVEAILGNTIKIAKKHELDVPRLELLFFLVNALNSSMTRPEWWRETVQ